MLFLFANIQKTEEGVGYPYLAGSCLAAAVLLALRVHNPSSILIQRSFVFLLAFLAYFLVKLIIDVPELSEIKARTIGTSGGLIFALFLGTIVSIFTSTIFQNRGRPAVRVLGASLVLFLTLYVAVETCASQLASIRADLFLVDVDSHKYQRPGSFIVIVAVIVSLLLGHIEKQSRERAICIKVTFLACIASYVLMIVCLLITAQLIGSNTGFVVTLFIAIGTAVWLVRPDLRRTLQAAILLNRRITCMGNFRRSIKRFLVAGSAVCLLVLGAAFLTFYLTALEPHHFRIFGFSEGKIGGTSLTSRLRLLSDNFLTQFAYNPIIGNLRADVLTTGSGSYAHSLLSIFSHLGIVGATLFACYVVAGFRDLARAISTMDSRYTNTDVGVLTVILLVVIIAFSVVGTFFTWMPLWFSLGLLLPAVILQEPKLFSERFARQVSAKPIDCSRLPSFKRQ